MSLGTSAVKRAGAVLALLGGCGHVPRVMESTTLEACAGATTSAVVAPTWVTSADIDDDGDADIVLLDVHAGRLRRTTGGDRRRVLSKSRDRGVAAAG